MLYPGYHTITVVVYLILNVIHCPSPFFLLQNFEAPNKTNENHLKETISYRRNNIISFKFSHSTVSHVYETLFIKIVK